MQEKKAVKEEKMKQEEKYMWAIVDGVKEKVTQLRCFLVFLYNVIYYFKFVQNMF